MIHHGDLFDVLPTLEEVSISACVTDPPYGIGFMGKKWDTFSPEKARASKAFAIGHGDKGRKDSVNPNLRGRRQSPAMSPSQIEYDRSLSGQREFQDWTRGWAMEVWRVLKPGAHLVVCGAPRSYHRMAVGLEDAGFEIRDCLAWIFGQGFPKSLNFQDGWGTALKPAYEPIVIARKPVEGTVAANRTAHGTGALNVDGCRIEGPSWTRQNGAMGSGFRTDKFMGAVGDGEPTRPFSETAGSDLGRWPANVALDEAAAVLLDAQSGERRSAYPGNPEAAEAYANTRTIHTDGVVYGERHGLNGMSRCDTGGASRFFYVAKPDRAERDRGTEGLVARQRDESRKEGNPGGDNPRNRGLQLRGNSHPTVKPLDLMRWLVRLVTPKGGTVLDPFMGSGTTGMACRYEGVEFIGIEREAQYVEIAERRIADCLPLAELFS